MRFVLIAIAITVLFSIQQADAATIDLDWEIGIHHGALPINVGDTVRWTWTDSFPHDVTETSPIPVFASATVAGAGNTFEFTFTTPGSFDYFCTIHGAGIMDGTIVVSAEVPAQITDLSYTAVSTTQADLLWSIPDDGGSPLLGYHVFRNLNGAGFVPLEAIGDPLLTSYFDNTLSPGDQVKYAVRAVNAIGNAAPSNIPPPVTLAFVPDGITDLLLSVESPTQVDLSWSTPNDNGSALLGYHIFRNLNGAGFVPLIAIPDGVITSYSDDTLTVGDSVTYAVRAVNAIGNAPISNLPNSITVGTP